MKKIAIILDSLEMGGLQQVTAVLANYLDKTNDVSLIILRNKITYSVDSKIINAKLRNTVVDKVIRKMKKLFFNNSISIYKKEYLFILTELSRERYDVIIASDGLMTTLCANVIKKLEYKPFFIGWMHNEYDNYMKTFKYIENDFVSSLNYTDKLIVLTKKDQEKYSVLNGNVQYIYNPLTINSKNASKLDKKEILFVGRISREQKGLDLLLEIIEKSLVNDWKLRIIGDGKDNKWLKTEIKKRNLNDRVILQGPVLKEIEKYYVNASIFISTSRWEGFGLVLTEAMTNGLPVIAFENAGPKEILENGKYGILVPKYDTNFFVEKLNDLMNNNNELLKFQALSLQRSKDFEIENIIQEWEAVINEKKINE